MYQRQITVAAAAVGCLLAVATELRAEHCASPSDRPAVCTVNFYGGFGNERLRQFDPERTELEIPAGQLFQLEFEALDQNRRRFPQERMSYGYDVSDCAGLVEIDDDNGNEGRFALRAGSRFGSCHAWFWVPGNLNLEWRLELKIAARERTSFSRAESELIAESLYRALLGRDADPQGLSDTTIEIQRGNLDSRLDDILESAEYRRRTLVMTPAAILESLYQGLFGRIPDSSAVRAFIDDVERREIGHVVRELLASEEFERRLLTVAGDRR